MEEWEKENMQTELAKNITGYPRVTEALNAMAKATNTTNITLMQAADYVDNFYCSYHLQK